MASKTIKNYKSILTNLKEKIRQARAHALISVNAQLSAIYWEIGNTISLQEKSGGWGTKVVENLAYDLKSEFPDMKGMSPRNLRYMRDFALAYPKFLILQPLVAKLQPAASKSRLKSIGKGQITKVNKKPILQPPVAKLEQIVALIPWTHNVILLAKVKDQNQRLFYAQKILENSWSKNVLIHQIESKLHKRQGKAITNFDKTLVKRQSDLAKEIIKNPYLFDFLGMTEEVQELELEKALIEHITKFLLELGAGFAFVGRQYHLEVGKEDFNIDLLFYHTKLHCYIVVDLKTGKFVPEFAGKLNFYLSAIDEQMKTQGDQPSIGILICKEKNKVIAEYSLRGIDKPIGVTEYKLTQALPKKLKGSLPAIQDIEKELKKKKT